MFEGLVQGFMGAPQGQSAMQQLGAQGFAPPQASGIIGTALPAAAQAMENAITGNDGKMGLLNVGQSHYVMNFMSSAVAGLIRGDGVTGGAIDGLEGVVGGQVAEVIASRCGLPQRIAGMIGAVLTPLMVHYLWNTFHSPAARQAQQAAQQGSQQQAMPGQTPPMGAMGTMGQMLQAAVGGFGYGQGPMANYNPAQFNPYTGIDPQPAASQTQNFYPYGR